MPDRKSQILNAEDIGRKTRRIAYQIAENNYEQKEIILVGIKEQGYLFANALAELIGGIPGFKAKLYSIKLNKENPGSEEIQCEFTEKDLKGRPVILVDDVANTGRTLAYALKPLLDCNPSKIQVAVLVDRKHKQFPVSADFVGLSLATTLQEHISVSLKGKKHAAYLS